MHTEDEAGMTKCCGPEGCGTIREGIRWCAGHCCMAWRWQPETLISRERPEGEGWERGRQVDLSTWQWRQTVVGYCGLAGRPE